MINGVIASMAQGKMTISRPNMNLSPEPSSSLGAIVDSSASEQVNPSGTRGRERVLRQVVTP